MVNVKCPETGLLASSRLMLMFNVLKMSFLPALGLCPVKYGKCPSCRPWAPARLIIVNVLPAGPGPPCPVKYGKVHTEAWYTLPWYGRVYTSRGMPTLHLPGYTTSHATRLMYQPWVLPPRLVSDDEALGSSLLKALGNVA